MKSVTIIGGPRDGEVIQIRDEWYPYMTFAECVMTNTYYEPAEPNEIPEDTFRKRLCKIEHEYIVLAEKEFVATRSGYDVIDKHTARYWRETKVIPPLIVGWLVIYWNKGTVS